MNLVNVSRNDLLLMKGNLEMQLDIIERLLQLGMASSAGVSTPAARKGNAPRLSDKAIANRTKRLLKSNFKS